MKKVLVAMLAMAAIVFASCDKDENGNNIDRVSVEFALTATPSSQKISESGAAAFTFTMSHNNSPAKYTATVKFTAVNGSVSPKSATTDENGNVTVTFTTTDPQGFEGGKVVAQILSVKGKDKDFLRQGDNIAGAIAQVLPLNGEEPGGGDVISDEGLKKADQLNDNEFVIDGKKQTIGEWDDDYVVYGVKGDNEGHRVLYVDFTREHPENSSVSGGMIHIVPELLGQEIDLLTNENNQVFAQLWTLKDVNQGYNPETNPEVSLSTYRDKENLAKATMKFTQDPQTGACSALVYMKTKEGQEAYCKVKATTSDPWQVQ